MTHFTDNPQAGATRRAVLIGLGAAALPTVLPVAARAAAAPDTLSGLIRVCGTKEMGPLLDLWVRAFRQRQPEVQFMSDLRGTATAQFGLHMNTADIAMSGRQIYPYEYYGIYRRSQLLTREVPVAIGSADTPGKSTAIGIFVHPDNPIRGLSVGQLDGIFGAQRTGGWQRMEWVTEVARGPEGNIRTWGQLGLGGAWKNALINPYGPPGVHPGGVSYFQTRVMGGADTWNERLREYPDRNTMLKAMATDRFSIGYAAMGYETGPLRALPLSEKTGEGLIAPGRASVADFSYPLSRLAYMYLTPDTLTGDPAPVAPHVAAFLEFVLSAEGQGQVAATTGYFPLTAAIAETARKAVTEPAQGA